MDARVSDPGHPITLSHPDETHVPGDAERLRQVVDNLLTNARVHTAPGTPIHIALEAGETEVVLAVADEGPGIAAEDAMHIFDRFYRADPSRSRARGGTGLGLAIVDSIVTAHDGRVTLDTTPGQGTTFTITLPRAQPARPEAERELVHAHP
jgi:two-component system OmpR family sensor kinase